MCCCCLQAAAAAQRQERPVSSCCEEHCAQRTGTHGHCQLRAPAGSLQGSTSFSLKLGACWGNAMRLGLHAGGEAAEECWCCCNRGACAGSAFMSELSAPALPALVGILSATVACTSQPALFAAMAAERAKAGGHEHVACSPARRVLARHGLAAKRHLQALAAPHAATVLSRVCRCLLSHHAPRSRSSRQGRRS